MAAPPLYRKLAAAILVNASVEQGRLEQAEAVLDGFGVDEGAQTQTSAVLRLARGRLRLAQERPAEALTDILAAGRIVPRHRVDVPGLPGLALGRGAGARRARRARGGRYGWPGRRSSSRAPSAASGRWGWPCAPPEPSRAAARARRSCARASSASSGAGIALERARALAELGVLVRATDRRAEARAMLREALDVAHHAGAAPLADRAEAELRATGAKPRRVALSGVESLTASERRVAELAGDGLDQPRDRSGALRDHAHGRGSPDARVRQARPELARGAARRSWARRGSAAGAATREGTTSSSTSTTPAPTERTRKPSRSSSERTRRLSASAVPVSRVIPFARARSTRRTARPWPMPRRCHASATTRAMSATAPPPLPVA